MIAMAIISLVIAVSYSTASRALQIGRRAQERTEALKEAESQVGNAKVDWWYAGSERYIQ
jgi:hypothetical protein